jgi:ribosomal protein S18 acetylase RimI-like enzyme
MPSTDRPTPPTLRAATAADAALLADLHTRSRATAYRGLLPDDYLDRVMPAEALPLWEEKLRAFADRGDAALIAEIDGRPAGFVCMLAPDGDGSVYIDNLHAAPDAKGRGVGTALLAEAAAWARARGARGMHLRVIEDNRDAIGFYEARGWRHVGGLDDVMGGAAIVARVYALALT